MERPEVSIVIPAHNEEETLAAAVYGAEKQFREVLEISFEIIIVEDGCQDSTEEIARSLDSEIDEVSHLHFDKRKGKGKALEIGFRSSDGKILAYMDADYSTDLENIPELVETVHEENVHLVIGSRRIPESNVDRSILRKLASWGYNNILRVLFRSRISDHQCGFKAAERKKLLKLVESFDKSHWVWDTELLIRAQRRGYNVEEIPVRWEERQNSSLNLLQDSIDMGFKTVELFVNLRKER